MLVFVFQERWSNLPPAGKDGIIPGLEPSYLHHGWWTCGSCERSLHKNARRWNNLQVQQAGQLVMHTQISHLRHRGKVWLVLYFITFSLLTCDWFWLKTENSEWHKICWLRWIKVGIVIILFSTGWEEGTHWKDWTPGTWIYRESGVWSTDFICL